MDFLGPMQMNGGLALPPPFSLSGSWEPGLEGWTTVSTTARSGTNPRTGSYSIECKTAVSAVYYTFAAADIFGLEITVSYYGRTLTGFSSGAKMQYQFAGESAVTFDTQNFGVAYTKITNSFVANMNKDLTVFIAPGGSAFSAIYIDDWSITGAAP